MPQRFMAGPGDPSGSSGDIFGDLAGGYAFGRVLKSTQKTYAKGWRMCVSWSVMRGKDNWLEGDMNGGELMEELAEVMAD